MGGLGGVLGRLGAVLARLGRILGRLGRILDRLGGVLSGFGRWDGRAMRGFGGYAGATLRPILGRNSSLGPEHASRPPLPGRGPADCQRLRRTPLAPYVFCGLFLESEFVEAGLFGK